MRPVTRRRHVASGESDGELRVDGRVPLLQALYDHGDPQQPSGAAEPQEAERSLKLTGHD